MNSPSDRTGVTLEPHAFSEHRAIEHRFRCSETAGTMLDIGAFDGRSFAPFLELGWKVHAFEPNPRYHDLLLHQYDSPRLTVHRYAISDEACEDRPFYATQEASAVASLHPFLSSHQEIARVPVRTLRQVISEKEIDRVDYLKIDVEGFDLPVLRGFPWESLRPAVVMCEFEDFKTRQVGYGTHDMGRFLLDCGYHVLLSEWMPIVRYGGTHRWRGIRTYPCELLDAHAWGNFIAVLPEELDPMVAALLDVIVADHEKQRLDGERGEESLGRTREALGQRNEMIQKLRGALNKREDIIEKLKTELANRDHKIRRIEAALERLDEKASPVTEPRSGSS